MSINRSWLGISLTGLLLFNVSTQAEERFLALPSIFMLFGNDACEERYVCQQNEICGDPGATALDNNCNGQVDEGCGCLPGALQSCFKGDPSYLSFDGCFAGTQQCTPSGHWGPCEGGVHATDACYDIDVNACTAIRSRPFVPVDLKPGTGKFSDDALTEIWAVTCPEGVNPCPTVTGNNPKDDFQALVSGEYSVSYTKQSASGSDMCTYPLFVGAPGLRVELNWEWPEDQPATVDLDLHLHKPGDTGPWGGDQGSAIVCAWDNCTALDCDQGNCPTWFAGTSPPDSVKWYLDPVLENNSCYFGPYGSNWQAIGQGCHNPRLDTDNISCDPKVTNPEDSDFCHAENANIDFPPLRQWTRIGVHYYSSNGQDYDVHPEVKIFCDGRPASTLGPRGFYNPQTPVSFSSTDSGNRFWLVADVAFTSDACGERRCIVKPLYSNQADRSPVLSTVGGVQGTFAPPYPALP